jgi:hypothetical protein
MLLLRRESKKAWRKRRKTQRIWRKFLMKRLNRKIKKTKILRKQQLLSPKRLPKPQESKLKE